MRGLPLTVAIEDCTNTYKLVIDDEIGGFPDLALARFAIADDHEYASAGAVAAGGQGQARTYAEAHAQAAGGGIEKRNAFGRVGVAIQHAPEGA